MCHSIYLQNAIDIKLRKKTIKDLCALIKKHNLDFDSIAFTGLSGALVAPSVADKLNKNLIAIRKDNCDSHAASYSDEFIEGNLDSKKYIIVDDLIFSGSTIKRIMRKIDFSECVGVFLYSPEMKKNNKSMLYDWADELRCSTVDSVYLTEF